MKTCTKCHVEKPRLGFSPQKTSRDGLHPWCPDCRAAAERERRQRLGESLLESERKRYRRDNLRAYRLRLRVANRERERLRDRERYAADPIPKQRRNIERARLRRLGYDREAKAYADILLRDPCAYCGRAERIEIDHIVPLDSGGTSKWWNLTAACRYCNAGKGARSLLTFLQLGITGTQYLDLEDVEPAGLAA